MTDFPLFSLYPDLLSQVINKFNEKSYFRLQQTCYSANDFIRTSRNISIPISDCYILRFDEGQKSFQFESSSDKVVPVEALYGTRLGQFKSYAATLEGHFEEVCECLKRNKITARWVLLSQIGLTREQCVTLLRILKPAKAVMNSEGSNRFETLLLSKTLKQIDVSVKQEDLATAATKLLSRFPEVELTIQPSGTDLVSLIRTVLSIFRSERRSNLRRFCFTVYGDGNTTAGYEGLLREFNLKALRNEERGNMMAFMDMPSSFPRESSCRVSIYGNRAEVLYLAAKDVV